MAQRPTDRWREQAAEPRSAEGTGFAELYPEPFVSATEQVLKSFESEVRALGSPSDDDVFAAVQRVVEGLNDVDESHDDCDYTTIEREDLCEFIDTVLTEAGIDLDGLAARRGLGRHEITDEWRDW
ncbi:hypothetical protein [Nonomuraea zeae]|uniref:Uncharacterized protein n=1 Tax=Nonomuraea zeae TaxID=1642303 RepID=A0A5S4GZ11_9ACTN|nr:hypothetical protein [Nonomuraea zeae]TMR37912.1 hypothetical protein ETD85_06745 [Nonomuraea zeae]